MKKQRTGTKNKPATRLAPGIAPGIAPRIAHDLSAVALRLEGTEQGIACEGTALERRTVKIRGKAFLFVGAADAMLKLGPSLNEAAAVETKNPDACRVGSGGWVKLVFAPGAKLPMARLSRWIEESYLLALKKAPNKRSASAR